MLDSSHIFALNQLVLRKVYRDICAGLNHDMMDRNEIGVELREYCPNDPVGGNQHKDGQR